MPMSTPSRQNSSSPQKIAVIGSGVSGLCCAALLAQQHQVALYEAAPRLGGHANTVEIAPEGDRIAVDTGFIVYNERTYPNLTALFRHFRVETAPAEMSFSVSLDHGALEYAGKDFRGLFAQPANALKPRFWSMIVDLLRFYRRAPRELGRFGDLSLGDYLARENYGEAFVRDHLLPMAAAIWSTPADRVGEFPAENFVRFCANHGLLQLRDRPVWRTPVGGSRNYVRKLAQTLPDVRLATPVISVRRRPDCAEILDAHGGVDRFDAVVLAAHADAALAMIETPSEAERRLLGAFRYADNHAVLHGDAAFAPKRRAAWAAWNFLAQSGGARSLALSYWMNVLQPLATQRNLFVTLNPPEPPRENLTFWQGTYRHPQFDAGAIAAQRALWGLQGVDRLWFCGAWFGSGFHEDGAQAGLAVAEQLGGLRRPWRVADENGRIHVSPPTAQRVLA